MGVRTDGQALPSRAMPDADLDLALLREQLQHPAPLVARFAEADDVGREELLANASESELRELSEAPAGHWDAINAFLDENVASDPGPPSGCGTGARRVLAGRARGSIRARGSLNWAIRYR